MPSNPNQIFVGVGAIIIKDNQVLLSKRKGSHASGTFGSLGDHLEYSESPTQALQREAMEELGIELENIEFLTCTNLLKYGRHVVNIEFLACTNLLKYGRHVVNIEFLAQIKSGQPKVMEPDKNELVQWFDLDNLPSPLFEPVKLGVEAYLKGKNYFEIEGE